MTRVGFVGLGHMGGPMCANVVAAGFPVTAYDLRPEAVAAAVASGATAGVSAAACASAADVLITMLPGPREVGAVLLGAGAALVIALSTSPVVVGAMFALEGFAGVTWNVITVSLRQSIIPDRLLGRVNSVYRLLGWGMMPIGAALGGLLGTVFGLASPFFVQAAMLGLMAGFALRLLSNRAIADARAAAAGER